MIPSIYNNLPECPHFQDRITRPKVLKLTTKFVFFVAEISPKNYLAEGVLKSDRFSATDEGVLRCRCLTSP